MSDAKDELTALLEEFSASVEDAPVHEVWYRAGFLQGILWSMKHKPQQ